MRKLSSTLSPRMSGNSSTSLPNSPLERIRARVATRVAELLPKLLLDAHITWHTRKGQRKCDCSFCREKLWGTMYIGYTKFPWQRWDETLQRFYPLIRTWTQTERFEKVDYDYVADAIMKEERERKRKIVRAQLKKRKEEML